MQAQAAPNTQSRIGQQLLAAGLISEEQLQTALEQQKKVRGFLGDILVRLGYVKADLVGQILSANIGFPYVHLADIMLDSEALDLLPEEFQRAHLVCPFRLQNGQLHVAMCDPLDLSVVDKIALQTGRKVVQFLAMSQDIQDTHDRIFSLKYAAEDALRDADEADGPEERDLDADVLADLAEDAPIVRLVNSILTGAIARRASDIHIEPQEREVRVRYRLDGVLTQVMTYPLRRHAAVASRIKIMAHLNIAERRRSQDGRISFSREGMEFDMRVSTMAMAHGEKVVMRILDKRGIQTPLEELGFFDHQLALWERFLSRSYGIVLVTGPTGSGKSTTLYASLARINRPETNIVTLEDPVEYHLAGINQAQVNPKINVTFASGLRTIVRQDPDVILVGEIRDRETAEIAVQAALTGHLVFSTLHTNDAPSAVVRLENLGVERFLITSAVLGVAAQRLLRKVCDGCAEPHVPSPEMLSGLGVDAATAARASWRMGKGCPKCAGQGYRGRLAACEIMPMSTHIVEAIRNGADALELKRVAVSEGMITMKQAGIRRAAEGATTLAEVCRVLLDNEEQSNPAIDAWAA